MPVENSPFPAHATLPVTYLEDVAWLKHPWHDQLPAEILMRKGVCLMAFHPHLLSSRVFLFAFPILPCQVSSS